MYKKTKPYNVWDWLGINFAAAPFHSAVLAFLALLNGLRPTITIFVTAWFVDSATAVVAQALSWQSIVVPLLLLVLMVAFGYFSGAVSKYSQEILTLRAQQNFRTGILEKCAKLEYCHIEKTETWDVIVRTLDRPEERAVAGYKNLISLAELTIQIVGLVFALASRVWWVAIIMLVFAVPSVLLAYKSGKKNYAAFERATEFTRRADYYSSLMIDREYGEERSLFGFSSTMNVQWEKQYTAASQILNKANVWFYARMRGTSMLVTCVALVTILALLSQMGGAITAGMLVGLTRATLDLSMAMSWKLSSIMSALAEGKAFFKDYNTLQALTERDGAMDSPQYPKTALESIEFKDVCFAYPGTDKQILNGVSFSIHPGKHYAFVGVNGAGKTTITKLLLGMYTNYTGSIKIGKKELRDYTEAQRKGLFSVVFQDFARYAVTFSDNIAMGASVPPQVLEKSIDDAGLRSLIDTLPDGHRAPLGKIFANGQDISSGQWQRVAIARSLCSPAPIRILDEPTAAMDPIGESKLYEDFNRISKGTTTITISHRLGSARMANEIVVLSDGKICEMGTHSQLMTENGIYAEMFESQRSWYQ